MTAEINTISMDESNVETADSRWRWLYKIGGAAALIAGVLFLIAVIDLIITGLQPGTTKGWLSLFQNNWLVVLFKLHTGFNGVQSDLLYVLNLCQPGRFHRWRRRGYRQNHG